VLAALALDPSAPPLLLLLLLLLLRLTMRTVA